MPGKWHNSVVQVLNELCDEWAKNGPYKKVCDGNSSPIAVSYKKSTYYYQPDLYAVYQSNEKIDVYEVIDAETEGEAVMDIVYSALTPRINVLSIVCSDESKLEAIKQHARIILNKTFNDDKKAYKHMYNPRFFVYLPRSIRSSKVMKKELKRLLEF